MEQLSILYYEVEKMNDYQILGVTPSTSMDDVKKAYRTLSRMYHPDNIKTGNAEKFKMVKSAYENIMNGCASTMEKPSMRIQRHLKHKTLFNFEVV